ASDVELLVRRCLRFRHDGVADGQDRRNGYVGRSALDGAEELLRGRERVVAGIESQLAEQLADSLDRLVGTVGVQGLLRALPTVRSRERREAVVAEAVQRFRLGDQRVAKLAPRRAAGEQPMGLVLGLDRLFVQTPDLADVVLRPPVRGRAQRVDGVLAAALVA